MTIGLNLQRLSTVEAGKPAKAEYFLTNDYIIVFVVMILLLKKEVRAKYVQTESLKDGLECPRIRSIMAMCNNHSFDQKWWNAHLWKLFEYVRCWINDYPSKNG